MKKWKKYKKKSTSNEPKILNIIKGLSFWIIFSILLLSFIFSSFMKSSNNISSSFHSTFISQQQDELSNLKLQVFEKGQSRKDYQNLLSRYHILKSDLEKIAKAKHNNELLLNRQKNEEKNFLISKLKSENDILFEKINEQIEKNKQLYNDNNYLYKEINLLHCENEEMKEQIKIG